MPKKFKVGDRVVLTDNFHVNAEGDVQKGDFARVTRVTEGRRIYVRFERLDINHIRHPQRHNSSWADWQFELAEPVPPSSFTVDFQSENVDDAIKAAELLAAHFNKPVGVKTNA